MSNHLSYIGLDIGTSGVRGIKIDHHKKVLAVTTRDLPAPEQDEHGASRQQPDLWLSTSLAVLNELVASDDYTVQAIATDGTSGTLLLADANGNPLSDGYMYNDTSCSQLANQIAEIAPATSAAHGASSPLARLMVMQQHYPQAYFALHQADWIAGQLSGRFGFSDDNNALKLGWDPVQRRWPLWFDELGINKTLLPEVLLPGSTIGAINPAYAEQLNLAADTKIISGTTDGCASFLATGAELIGDAVTALGSTMTVKLLSQQPIFAPQFGIYSHRLGNQWLAGGASNTGGAALLQFFTTEQMAALTPLLKPDQATGLTYYPLPATGERFPVADPEKRSLHQPRPDDDATFFQGLLEGIATTEALAYTTLQQLGGPELRSLRTVGGGANNAAWTKIRQQLIGKNIPFLQPLHTEAAYGTALLARQAFIQDEAGHVS